MWWSPPCSASWRKAAALTGFALWWRNRKIDLAAAEERFSTLQQIFGNKVGLVHGKMKEKEKDEVMERFKSGAISLLVATTVIEVGVNVPEATVMVIEHAERFGLAQLHQLRGRIKRGFQASTCILLYSYPLSETSRQRLNTMRETEDGFEIAEKIWNCAAAAKFSEPGSPVLTSSGWLT